MGWAKTLMTVHSNLLNYEIIFLLTFSFSFVTFGLVLCVVTSGGRLEGTCLASAWTEFGFFVFLTISGFTPETEPIALNIYRPEGQVMQCSD